MDAITAALAPTGRSATLVLQVYDLLFAHVGTSGVLALRSKEEGGERDGGGWDGKRELHQAKSQDLPPWQTGSPLFCCQAGPPRWLLLRN